MSDYTDALDDIKREALDQCEITRKIAANHQLQSEEVIANLAALRTMSASEHQELDELMKHIVGNPQ